jgi:2-polyprenyl-6-methoxyphenol hydroxylase-like FAD-dependent oxidoreductase
VLIDAHGLTGGMLEADGKLQAEASDDSRIGAGVILRDGAEALEAGTIYMACGEAGYLGAVRVEQDQVDLAAAFDPQAVKRLGGLGRVAQSIAEQTQLPPLRGLAELPWQGTPLLTRRRKQVAAERMFVVGDAAGYVEPFTGEGIAWALAGSQAVVPLVQQTVLQGSRGQAEAWIALHRRMIRRRQWLIRGLAGALRKQRLTQMVVAALAVSPWLATPITRWLDVMPATTRGRQAAANANTSNERAA